MRIRFTCGVHCFELDFPPEVAEAIEPFGDLFAVGGAGFWPEDSAMEWDRVVSAEKLRNALVAMRASLDDAKKDTDYAYTSRARAFPGSDLEEESSGVLHGFRIDGEIYSLTCGLNLCLLEKWKARADGTGEIVSRQDMRDVKFIDTDDFGRIMIKRRKVAGAVKKWIGKLLKRLAAMDGDVIVEFA